MTIVDEQKKHMEALLHNNLDLCSFFDENKKLHDKAREALLKIASFFHKEHSLIFENVVVKDIVLIGGMASYIYSNDTDIDVVIVLGVDEGIIPQEEFRFLLKKINWGFVRKNFRFSFLNRPVDCGFNNITNFGGGVYSLLSDKWLSEPVYREFPYSIDEFHEKYWYYSKQIHKEIASFPKINNEYFSIEGCEKMNHLLIRMREDALNAKVSDELQEYCMEYQFYRCAKLFGVIDYFRDLITQSYRFNFRNEIEI